MHFSWGLLYDGNEGKFLIWQILALSFPWTRPQLMKINKRKKFGILCAVNWCHFIISTENGNSWKLSNNVPLVRQQTQQKWVRSQDKCANSLFFAPCTWMIEIFGGMANQNLIGTTCWLQIMTGENIWNKTFWLLHLLWLLVDQNHIETTTNSWLAYIH